jgi:hypothetical protein
MLSGGIDEMSDGAGTKRPPVVERSLAVCRTSISTGGSDETLEPSE